MLHIIETFPGAALAEVGIEANGTVLLPVEAVEVSVGKTKLQGANRVQVMHDGNVELGRELEDWQSDPGHHGTRQRGFSR